MKVQPFGRRTVETDTGTTLNFWQGEVYVLLTDYALKVVCCNKRGSSDADLGAL